MKKTVFAIMLALPLILSEAFGEQSIEVQSRNALTIAKAKEHFGRHFLGAEAIERAFGYKVDENAFPFPLSAEEIDLLDTSDWMVILQVDTLKGHRATIKFMQNSGGTKTCDGYPCIGQTLFGIEKESFYMDDAPRAGWKIVTRENIPESTSLNYSDQTKKLEEYIGGSKILTDNETLRGKYARAAERFRKIEKPGIDALLSPKKQTPVDSVQAQSSRAALKLAAVEINLSSRETAVEVFYRMLLCLAQNKERIFEDSYVMTSSMTADNRFVSIGTFIIDGVAITAAAPGYKSKNGGVTCSRMLTTFQQP